MSREFRHRVSLTLNVVLAAAVTILVLHKTNRIAPPSARAAGLGKTASGPADFTSQSKLPRYVDIITTSDRRRWMDLLCAAGLPQNILARVIIAESDERWQRRLDERQDKFAHGEATADELAAMGQEWDREKEADLRAGLGAEGFTNWDRENILRELNLGKVHLTTDETNTLYAWKKQLLQHIRDLQEAERLGKIDGADIADAQDKAQAEFDQKVKTLLGADRFAATQESDDVPADLRRGVSKLKASESQFQDLLQAQRQWNEQRAALDEKIRQDPSLGSTYEEQMKTLDQARDSTYQQVLGTELYDIYQKQQDARFNQMKHYADAWGMNDSNIDYVYGTIRYYEKGAQDYEAQARALAAQGQKVDWDAVDKNLQQFAEQTLQTLQTYLGQDRLNKLQRNGVFQFNQ